MTYKFRTDSEVGTIEAGSWPEACQLLHVMVPDAAVVDGAWGWIEREDGERYCINCDR